VFTVWFGSVFIKKSNQIEFFLKKPKPVQTGLARFFPVWLGFFGLARFFQFGSVLFRFGSVFFPVFFGSGSVRFGFLVPSLKNQNQTKPVGFFKILIGFFSWFGFFDYFFPVFSV